MIDSLGDRMKKKYESVFTSYLPKGIPVICRVDGQAFHTYTRGMKPFDSELMNTMVWSAAYTMPKIAGCKLAYVQSDEISFLITDYDTIATEAYFDYNVNKLNSIIASMVTANFNHLIPEKLATFDCRCFVVPQHDVANYFLWRAKDWERNSLNMYCSQFFSAKELHGLNSEKRHQRLYGIGKNWATDLTDQQKNGTFVTKEKFIFNIKPHYQEIAELINAVLPQNSIDNSRAGEVEVSN